MLLSHGCAHKVNMEEHFVDLSYSINPMGMPAHVMKALMDSCHAVNRYPETDAGQLRKMIAGRYSLPEEYIQTGNGASELIYALCRMLEQDKKVLIIEPTFTEYEAAARAAGLKIKHYKQEVKSRFNLPNDVIRCVAEDISAVFLCNPNNPTGTYVQAEELLLLLKECKKRNVKLIVDECFFELSDYGNTSGAIGMVEKYDNLVVLKAFTKCFAMPGVRLGYLVCSDRNFVGQLKSSLPPWNLSIMAQVSGIAALTENGDYSVDRYFELSREFIRSQREKMIKKLRQCKAVNTVYDSCVNFILIKAEPGLYERLLKQSAAIRNCDDFYGLDESFFRVAVGTAEQNNRLMELLCEEQ